MSPAKGKRGAIVTISGSGFGSAEETSTVKFGDATCPGAVSWSDNRLVCKVPAKARVGKVKVVVTTASGASNARVFTVKRGGPPPPVLPGRPTGKAPRGTVTTETPTFAWTEAKAARVYELRVLQGSSQQLAKVGITETSYTSKAPLPTNEDLTWQVRARNEDGVGEWSEPLAFKVVEEKSLKDLLTFGFTRPSVVGQIDQRRNAVTVLVPRETDVTNMTAVFTTNGVAVDIQGRPQTSGVTANSFVFPLTYTVTAFDGTKQDCSVTVLPLGVGDPYQGGVVAYLLRPGDPGFVEGEMHGLIATLRDVNPAVDVGVIWSTVGGEPGGGAQIRPVAQDARLGAGRANTEAIVNQTATVNRRYVTCTGGAAYTCYHLQEGGYDDWFLPSKDELDKLFQNREAVGGFAGYGYWSSTDNYDAPTDSATAAWIQVFSTGEQQHRGKWQYFGVRAVRAF